MRPCVQWQPDGLTIHTNKWSLGARFPGASPISLIPCPGFIVHLALCLIVCVCVCDATPPLPRAASQVFCPSHVYVCIHRYNTCYNYMYVYIYIYVLLYMITI